MGVMDFFWIFLMLTALQPVVKQKLLDAARQRMIAKIERRRGSRVILMVHRQETMSFLGFPVVRYIDIQDSEEVIRAIHLTDPDIPLDLVLQTPGGLVLASLQIARAIRDHRGKVTVFVPHYAMSGGTLIALAADEIVMCRHAVLGPVDPQLGRWPAVSILDAVQRKPAAEVDDETLILADQARKAMNQLRGAVKELLEGRFPPDKADELAAILSEGKWTHDYPITCNLAESLGLPIRCDVPTEILQLLQLFPQPVRRHSAVEYIPEPYRGRKPNGSVR
ncbi:MAG: SDH family Clp fold serine proteinase [Thermoguttaceae bacterium]